MNRLERINIAVRRTDNEESPLEEWNLWKFIFFHKNYKIGDEYLTNYVPVPSYEVFGNWDNVRSWIKLHKGDVIIKSVYVPDDTTLAFFTDVDLLTCANQPQQNWVQVGFAVTTKEEINTQLHITRLTKKQKDRIMDILAWELKRYQSYLNNQIFSLVLALHTNEGVKIEYINELHGWNAVEKFTDSLKQKYKGKPITLMPPYDLI